jgi:glycosyltransferase involved in cell wall biosynthesis
MYNCEKQIVRVINQFNDEVNEYIDEILIVDNRSTDNSVEVATTLLKERKKIKAHVVQNDENFNLGGSHKVAFNYAVDNGFDYVIVLHGDDQGHINDIIPYIKDGTFLQYDSLLGARFLKGAKITNYSFTRILGNWGFNTLASIITLRKIYDLGSGLNLYSTDFLKSKFYLFFPNHLMFNEYLLLYTCWVKSKFRFVPITWREEDQVSNAKLLKVSYWILEVFFKYFISAKKLFSKETNIYSEKDYTYKRLY